MIVKGCIDCIIDNCIYGWIKDTEAENPVRIDIFGDGEVIASNVLANLFRIDLKDSGLGNGFYGFAVPVAVDVKSDGILVVVREAGVGTDLLRRSLNSAAQQVDTYSASPEKPQAALQDPPFDVLEETPTDESQVASSRFAVMPQCTVSSLDASVLKGRYVASPHEEEGAEVALRVHVDAKSVLEGWTRPIIAAGENLGLSAEFEIDLAEMDMLARAHTVETLNRWLESGTRGAFPIAVSWPGSQGVSPAEPDPVPSPDSIRQLVDILLGLGRPSLLTKALRFRKALEQSGLWMSEPLRDEHQQAAVCDPALLCFDLAYFAATYPAEFQAGSSAKEGLETFRNLAVGRDIRPNLLFAEFWYRRHRREIAQTLVCGTFRSGLDHFLEDGLTSGLSPCEWISVSPEYDAQARRKACNPILDWLQDPGGTVPAGLDVRRPDGAAALSGKLTDLIEALRCAAQYYGPSSEQAVVYPILGGHLRGKSLVLINTNTTTRNYHITRAIFQDACTLLGAEKVRIATYDNLVEICSKLKDPILLCVDGQRLNSDIVHAANRYCSATVLWTFDDPYNLNDHIETADLFDLICTNDLACKHAYGDRGFYLPLAAPGFLLNEGGAPPHEQFDIFFCGTAWPNRIVLINKLIRDRPHLRYKFALTYNSSVPTLPLTASLSSYLQSVSFADFIGYAKRSRITLSLHRNFAGTDVFSASSNPGPRVFEIGAAGAFQISENGGNGFESLFPHELLTYYDDYDELLRLIDKALAEPEARKRSAQLLQDRIAATHTYRHRLSVILDELARSVRPKCTPVIVPSSKTSDRPKLLYVVHNTVKHSDFGGLEVHQDLLAQNLKNQYEISFFYTTEVSPGKRKAVIADSSYRTLETSDAVVTVGHANLESPSLEKFFGRCVAKYNIEMIHFFHFINQTPSLAHVARSYGVPYGISFHDFYTACRQFNLLDYSEKWCRNERIKQSDCDICLKKLYKFPERSQLARRDYYGDVIGKAATLMFVSSSTRDIHEGIYPQIALAGDSRVHGAPIPHSKWALTRRTGPSEVATQRPTRFLVLGNFDKHKGAAYLLDAIGACRELDAEFHFHGGANEKLRELFTAELGAKAIFHGRYKPGDIDVGRYDFSLHLSIWPETYCQTLSEAWAARVVPIVTDIGALGHRVQHGVNGYKVDPARPATLARLLSYIVNDRRQYLAIRSNINDELFLEQSEHARLYEDAYQQVLETAKRPLRNRDNVVSPRGVTMEVLQRKRRTSFWNQGKGKHLPNREIVPNMLRTYQVGQLRPFQGKIEIAEGSFDSAGTYDMHQVGCSPIVIKNDQALMVQGWVRRPRDQNHVPVAVLRTDARAFVHSLSVIERPDVAEAIAAPGANLWGIGGEIRMLTLDEIISGAAELSLGWHDPKTNVIQACQKSVPIIGALGG